jgi:hypothetical protein
VYSLLKPKTRAETTALNQMANNEPQYLTDLRNGKTLSTLHISTGGVSSYQWDEERQTMFVHSWNQEHPERGCTTKCENWYMGTLQLPFRKRHEAFKTSF